MRCRELILEDISQDERKQIIKTIQRDCKMFFNLIDDQPLFYSLYRGINDARDYGRKKIRLYSRKPKDSSQLRHDQLNNYFVEKYDHPYRNGLFAVGDRIVASEYGTGSPKMVFPIGNFEFVWSRTIADLFIDIDNGSKGVKNWTKFLQTKGISMGDLSYSEKVNMIKQYDIGELIDFLGGYQSNEFESAITSGHEIMIWCKEYYYIDDDIFVDTWKELYKA